MYISPPPQVTQLAPEKRCLGDYLLSYWVSVTFHGQAVKLRGGITSWFNEILTILETKHSSSRGSKRDYQL